MNTVTYKVVWLKHCQIQFGTCSAVIGFFFYRYIPISLEKYAQKKKRISGEKKEQRTPIARAKKWHS